MTQLVTPPRGQRAIAFVAGLLVGALAMLAGATLVPQHRSTGGGALSPRNKQAARSDRVRRDEPVARSSELTVIEGPDGPMHQYLDPTAPKELTEAALRVRAAVLADDWEAARDDLAVPLLVGGHLRFYQQFVPQADRGSFVMGGLFTLDEVTNVAGDHSRAPIGWYASTFMRLDELPSPGSFERSVLSRFSEQIKSGWSVSISADEPGGEAPELSGPAMQWTIASNLECRAEFVNDAGSWKAKRFLMLAH